MGVFPAERHGGAAFPAGASSEQVTGFLVVIRPPAQVYDGFLWQAWKLSFLFLLSPSLTRVTITYVQIKSRLMMGFMYPVFKLRAWTITLQCTRKTHTLYLSPMSLS